MTTPRLNLPEISVGQAAKEIAHNDALRVIDALLSGHAITRTQTSPPASPTEGDVHIVPSGASGAWAGQTHKIAGFYANAWYFYTPKIGMYLWSDEDNEFVIYSGVEWAFQAAKSFTVATLPPQKTGRIIYVSDASGGATLAFSDGTNWRRTSDLTVVS